MKRAKNMLLFIAEFILLLLFLIECIIKTIIFPIYWKVWKSKFIIIKLYHGLNNKYRKPTGWYNQLGIILIFTLLLSSCSMNDDTRAKRILERDTNNHKFRYEIVLDNSDMIIYTNKKYNINDKIITINNNLRSYQIDCSQDGNYLYDGNRLVGFLPFNMNSKSLLDSLIFKDNK